MIFFSVIIPVFNGERFLEEAIHSVLEQTYTNWELIIIDDGSTDRSIEIAHALGKMIKKIIVLQHEGAQHKGVSASRNLAINISKGNWISLLDSDDSWFPDKLEREVQVICSHPETGLIYSKAQKSYTDKSIIPTNIALYGMGATGEITDPFRKLIAGFLVSTSAVTFKKENFIKCGGFNEKFIFSEDTLLFHQLMEHGNVFCIDETLGTHRIHESSVVSTTSPDKKVISRYMVYEQLILNVKTVNIPLVSSALINPGLQRIFRTFILYPTNRFDLVLEYLVKTLGNSKILIRHKIKAIFMFLTEILISPMKAIWLKVKFRKKIISPW